MTLYKFYSLKSETTCKRTAKANEKQTLTVERVVKKTEQSVKHLKAETPETPNSSQTSRMKSKPKKKAETAPAPGRMTSSEA